MNHIHLHVDDRVALKEQGDLFGVFFEDLNHAADGGLYAELVRNRSFEFDPADNPAYHALTGWETVERGAGLVTAHVETTRPLNEHNTHYLALEVPTDAGEAGVRNLGFGSGVPVARNATYRFSCRWRLRGRSRYAAPLVVRLESADGSANYGEVRLDPAVAATESHETETTGQWQSFEAEITASDTNPNARLALVSAGPLAIDLDMVSLMPADTFHGHANGMRRDLAEMIESMQPRFVRFPGGCLTHVGTLDASDRTSVYRWKSSVGDVQARPTKTNVIWKYNQTLGLGFYELFRFCEDIGAEAMPVVSAGWNPHARLACPMEDIGEWVDDALDLIEFATGPADSAWGKVRADMGHPSPFPLKYLGIGNEETGAEFFERARVIAKAVRERYPGIHVIISGMGFMGDDYDEGRALAVEVGASHVDEHYYPGTKWMLMNDERYMSQPEDGVTTFIGEYSSRGKTWGNALAEAAYLTGIERSKAVTLACYAPLLCHTDYANWDPDLIYFDNHRVCGTPSYYVQRLFSRNQGDQLVASSWRAEGPLNGREDGQRPRPHSLAGTIAFQARRSRLDILSPRLTDVEGTTLARSEQLTLDASGRTIATNGVDAPEAIAGDTTHGTTQRREFASVPSERYDLTFGMVKTGGTARANLRGEQEIQIIVGMQDEDTNVVISFDGYQSCAGLSQRIDGQDFSLDRKRFALEPGRTYEVAVHVRDGHIAVDLDGERFMEGDTTTYEPKALYHSAVREANGENAGETIVKLVNVLDEGETVSVTLDGWDEGTARIEMMDGYLMEATNTLDDPEHVIPHTSHALIEHGAIDIALPPHSLAILRCAKQ